LFVHNCGHIPTGCGLKEREGLVRRFIERVGCLPETDLIFFRDIDRRAARRMGITAPAINHSEASNAGGLPRRKPFRGNKSQLSRFFIFPDFAIELQEKCGR
jgi:hypothetical protein